jgi:hypothetical protein
MSMLKLGEDKAKSVPRRWVCAPLGIALEDIGLGISFFDDSGRMTTNENLELIFS